MQSSSSLYHCGHQINIWSKAPEWMRLRHSCHNGDIDQAAAWILKVLLCLPQFGILNGHKKLQTVYSGISESSSEEIKLYTLLLGGRAQVWVQIQAPAGHLAWLLKAVPEDNQRFWLQNQRLSPWGSAPAQLWLVRLASNNSKCFLVLGSCCWQQLGQQQVHYRKICCLSCYID